MERLGAATLSTDAVVHELYEDDEVRAAVLERFGTTDRSEIARAAFATEEGRKWLEELLWPRVGQRMW
ncbi:MAG: dephospho-CoA kinase, partial [Solirubrobacteraceae bacterium]